MDSAVIPDAINEKDPPDEVELPVRSAMSKVGEEKAGNLSYSGKCPGFDKLVFRGNPLLQAICVIA